MKGRGFGIVTLLSVVGLGFGADIDVVVRFDKERHLAGEPVYLIWKYTNNGKAVARFQQEDLYCMEPDIETTSLRPAMPLVFPSGGKTFDCLSGVRELRPGESHTARYLLNGRFDLNRAGTYELTAQKRTLSLVLDRASERDLKAAYEPYFAALNFTDRDARIEALRALAGSGARFTEDALLEVSIDPRSDSHVRSIADDGLARLRTPRACAWLAELATHPELHDQQRAIEYLGQCGDPGYMPLLFGLAERRDVAPATRDFALFAAGEAGGKAAVDHLVGMTLRLGPERDAAFVALGRTGSERAVKAIIDALPSLAAESTRYASLAALRTLTHRESRQSGFEAGAKEWRDWWAAGNREIYRARDGSGGVVGIR